MDALLADPAGPRQVPLRQSLLDLLDTLRDDARQLGCEHWLNALRPIVTDEAGDAAWLRGRQRQHNNLNDVVRDACERLMPRSPDKSWENIR